MKKLSLFLLVFLTISFSSTSYSNFHKVEYKVKQSDSIKAYIYYQGVWHEGYITYNKTENDYTLNEYQFNDLYLMGGRPFSGYFRGQRFTQLNPNNELAKQYNFTHYVEIQGTRVYIIGKN